MARAVTLGNGNMLVGLDYKGQLRDLYFPFVGENNHVSGASGSFVHRIGIFIDGSISWLESEQWNVTVGCDAQTVVGSLHAVNETLGITISSTDVVHNEKNIFIRSFTVSNERKEKREIKIFFSQQFRISESRRGDTGYFDPRAGAIVHYKGTTAFLINAFLGEKQFTDFNIGLFGIEGREGTYHDAYDGILEHNPIEHGSVDSVIGITTLLEPHACAEITYWIACGATIAEVHELNAYVLSETPKVLIRSTKNYWKAWIGKEKRDLTLLSPKLRTLFNRSLTTIRVHADNHGGIIASSDTDMLHHGRDTYSYVWPRDAAIVAYSLDQTGYSDVAERFFSFISERIEKEGYLMHKYRADGVLGSSWHPWMYKGKPHLPIQIDETALPIFMLWQHYQVTLNLEFIESLYNPYIEKSANFMCEFVEPEFGLPKNSYDLWEEKCGMSTYSACAVYGALTAASCFANLLGKEEASRTYAAVAQRMQGGIMEHLYDADLNMFIKHIYVDADNEREYDRTIDVSSFFGPLYFNVLDKDDERITKAFKIIEERLRVHTKTDGYIRYEGDNYYRLNQTSSPNPWVIATLWIAQYHIMTAKKVGDLTRAYELLEWTCKHATKSGVLAEQIHPHTGEMLSTAPLTWSHAEFVITVNEYIKKHTELSDKK